MIQQFDLLLISPEQELKDEIKVVIELFNLGLSTYHLRKPTWKKEELQGWLKDLPKEFCNRIVLHSHFELSEIFELKGIHLNEKNKPLASQLKSYKIISSSFHSLEDLKASNFPYQYVFLSPVFDSISKAEYKTHFDIAFLGKSLGEIKQQNPAMPKVIALGGINAQNISKLKSAGLSGAALLGAVWQSENPVEAFAEIQALIGSSA